MVKSGASLPQHDKLEDLQAVKFFKFQADKREGFTGDKVLNVKHDKPKGLLFVKFFKFQACQARGFTGDKVFNLKHDSKDARVLNLKQGKPAISKKILFIINILSKFDKNNLYERFWSPCLPLCLNS